MLLQLIVMFDIHSLLMHRPLVQMIKGFTALCQAVKDWLVTVIVTPSSVLRCIGYLLLLPLLFQTVVMCCLPLR